jgi:NAD(P)-dependent dehydrogenase (short-subunit alcohol dehydrogenase family)
LHLPLAEVRHQLDVNLLGVLDVTQKILPLLGARKDAPHPPGRIINISSVSGKIVYPFMGPYAASKHALEALSDALRRELLVYGIDVVVIEPSAIQTPIWDKASQIDVEQYADTDYLAVLGRLQKALVSNGQAGLPVEKVSKVIWQALTKKRPKTRYVVVRNWLTNWFLPFRLPDRRFDALVAKRFGLKYLTRD